MQHCITSSINTVGSGPHPLGAAQSTVDAPSPPFPPPSRSHQTNCGGSHVHKQLAILYVRRDNFAVHKQLATVCTSRRLARRARPRFLRPERRGPQVSIVRASAPGDGPALAGPGAGIPRCEISLLRNELLFRH